MKNKKLKFKILFLIIFFSFFGVIENVSAATYYIKDNGNDSLDGLDDSTAWASLDMIRTNVSSGDTVYLKRGSVWENDATEDYASIYIENKNNITIDAYDSGERPIIDNTGQNDTGGDENYPDYNCIEVRGTSENTSIKNIEVRGALDTSAIFIKTDLNDRLTEIDGCKIGGVGQNDRQNSMVLIREAHVNISNSFFSTLDTFNVYKYSQHIQYKYDGYGDITDSTFHGIPANGVRMVQYSGVSGKTIYWERNYFYTPDIREGAARAYKLRSAFGQTAIGATFIIRNNVIDFTGSEGLDEDEVESLEVATIGNDYGCIPTVYYYNNTVISDGEGTFMQLDQLGPSYIYNNIIYNLGSGVNHADSLHHFRNNIFYNTPNIFIGTPGTDSNNITTDPNLVTPLMSNNLATDAMIQSPSDAIDGSYTTGSYIPTDDYSENLRDGSPDIGAFEYIEPSDTTSPSAPGGLAVD